MRTKLPPDAPDHYVIEDYGDLVEAFRTRRIGLAMSQLALDDRAGLPTGYTGKVEVSHKRPDAANARSLGRLSLPLMLGALKCQLVLVPKGSLAVREGLTMAERGRRGAEVRRARLTPDQRAAIARKAAAARWAKVRPQV